MQADTHTEIIGWLHSHQKKDTEMFNLILEKLDALDAKLEPISDLYKNMSFMSKVFLGMATAAAFLVGLGLSIKELWK